MTPQRMARLVARWVRFYTRNLPPSIAERRIDEIDADLHDQIAHERAGGTADRRIAVSIAVRMVRGLAADASWRTRHANGRPARRSAVRIALPTALVLLLPLVGMQVTDEIAWSPADFVFAGALLAGSGLLLELAARRSRNIAFRAAAVVVGVAAIALGEADDAPGLMLFGGLLVVGTVALAVRTAQRSE